MQLSSKVIVTGRNNAERVQYDFLSLLFRKTFTIRVLWSRLNHLSCSTVYSKRWNILFQHLPLTSNTYSENPTMT